MTSPNRASYKLYLARVVGTVHSGRGYEYGYAYENHNVIRAAIDRSHVKPQAAIAGAKEIAFFPPMTGG